MHIKVKYKRKHKSRKTQKFLVSLFTKSERVWAEPTREKRSIKRNNEEKRHEVPIEKRDSIKKIRQECEAFEDGHFRLRTILIKIN